MSLTKLKMFGAALFSAAFLMGSFAVVADQPGGQPKPAEGGKPKGGEGVKPKGEGDGVKPNGVGDGVKPKGEGDGVKPKGGERDGVKPKGGEGDKPKAGGERGLPDGKRFNGRLAGVDDAGKMLTVKQRGDQIETMITFVVTPETKVTVDGKPAKLAEIPNASRLDVGYAVQSNGKHDSYTATEVRAHGSEMKFTVAKVDGQALYRNAEGGNQAIPVAKDAEIQIGGESGKLSDIQPNDQVSVTKSADESAIVRIQVRRGAAPGRGEK